MKITITHRGTTIIVDESDNVETKDNKSCIKWSDQNKQIQDTICVMAGQLIRIRDLEDSHKLAGIIKI